jgi:NAD(P)-dependent dehydrogenase (short-subunit alcohol dehydrogenase family)
METCRSPDKVGDGSGLAVRRPGDHSGDFRRVQRQSGPGAEQTAGPVSVAYAASKTFLNAVTLQYARELSGTNVLINAGCPGYVATDLNGFRGVRTPEQGAAIAIKLATLPDEGPTGQFFDDAGTVPW